MTQIGDPVEQPIIVVEPLEDPIPRAPKIEPVKAPEKKPDLVPA